MSTAGLLIAGAALITVGVAAQTGAIHLPAGPHPAAPSAANHAVVRGTGSGSPATGSPTPRPTPVAATPAQAAAPVSHGGGDGGDGGGDGGDGG